MRTAGYGALFAAAVAVAAACGGKTTGIGGSAGGGGSGAGAGGPGGAASSSSGGDTGGSGTPGGCGDDSTAGSCGGGGAGSSSGASGTCSPMPGCDSTTQCPNPTGCGDCYCGGGIWACSHCIDASVGPDSGIVGPPPCPDPGSLPPDGSACVPTKNLCIYPALDCGLTCTCPTGTWECTPGDCADASSSGGGNACPSSEPGAGAPCSSPAIICSYFNPCEDNCFCATTGWACAPVPGCPTEDGG